MANVKIIGTSHIASQSVQEIRNEFSGKELPDIVAVELDKQRAASMFQEPRLPSVREIPRLGVAGYTFALIGTFIQRKFGAKVGIAPGEDMRTAIKSAKKYNRKLYLIDQPLRKTLRNLSEKMSFWEKGKLVLYGLGLAFLPFVKLFKRRTKKIDLSKTPPEELVNESISKMQKNFPGLYAALIADRNKHMARNIRYLKTRFPDKKILVVVGAGHKNAIRSEITTPAVAS